MEATDYFQFLQKLYTSFASSTHRWNVLKKSLGPGIVVKRLSDTRWSARADAVSALQKSYPSTIKALRTMNDRGTKLGAFALNTVLLIEMWSNILVRCNETSSSRCGSQVGELPDYVCEGSRTTTNTIRSRQRSSRLTFFDGATEDTQFQSREKFRIEVYLPIINTLITQLQ
ncbi:hypothetical protein RI129_010529 [Pyrocoelia pectoralis]|uniref:Uncharacterized protein n=1 Tax=Pyrocoelia pectoralis TaxID=417401 RepID=A0AAN7V3G0_9COLE